MSEQLNCPECDGVDSSFWTCSVCKDKGSVTVGVEVEYCDYCNGKNSSSWTNNCTKCRGKRVVRKR